MNHGFSIDPYAVLNLRQGATAPEVREAYRQKTKKHHPDHGGDEWAFRIVVRAYELLSTGPGAVREAPPEPAGTAAARPAGPPPNERIRRGVQDRVADPRLLVDVEILWFRFEVADLFELLNSDPEETNLSGSINLVWPSAEAAGRTADPALGTEILGKLDAIFEEMCVKTRVVTSRLKRDAGRFSGWLSYPSGERAWNAFKVLHDLLKARGLGARQWTRDLIVPRE